MRGDGRELHRWRARRHPEPRAAGLAGGGARHHRAAPAGDGRGGGGAGRAARLAGVRRLRAARRGPAPAAAPGLLRADAAARGRRAARAADARVPAARRHDVRRARRLPAPGPHHVPQREPRGVPRGGGPDPLPQGRGAVAAEQAVLQPDAVPGADHGVPRGDDRGGAGVAVRGVDPPLGGAGRASHHHAGAVRRLVRRPRPGAGGARDPGRPVRHLVRRPARDAAPDLADRGLRARTQRGAGGPARGRPVRGHPDRSAAAGGGAAGAAVTLGPLDLDAAVTWAATSTPTPPPPESVTPGLWGFLVVFILAIVVWLLMRNMTQRLRRLRFREQERLRREGGPTPSPDAPDAPDDRPPSAPR